MSTFSKLKGSSFLPMIGGAVLFMPAFSAAHFNIEETIFQEYADKTLFWVVTLFLATLIGFVIFRMYYFFTILIHMFNKGNTKKELYKKRIIKLFFGPEKDATFKLFRYSFSIFMVLVFLTVPPVIVALDNICLDIILSIVIIVSLFIVFPLTRRISAMSNSGHDLLKEESTDMSDGTDTSK